MTSHVAPGAEMLPGLRAAVDDAKVRAAQTRARKAAEWEPAEVDPVARVLLDVPLAHLDRPFDYAVPAAMGEAAQPGVRVRVRFAGADVDGFVVERRADTEHQGRLQPLRRVVSPEPVLAPEIADLSVTVSRRYAGTRADVLRLAVPPRHARTEKERPATLAPEQDVPAAGTPSWAGVEHAAAFFAHLTQGASPRAVWGAAPGDDWATMVAEAASTTAAAGRGVLICVPDARDVHRVAAALDEVMGSGRHAVLTAESGPSQRYREFLRVSRGSARVVVGTRSAVFAPVHDLGLLVMWDDGDDLYAEPRAPYPHTREVLLMRSEQQSAAVLLGGFARSVEAQHLLASGWAHELVSPRDLLRARAQVRVLPAEDLAVATRIPHAAVTAMRSALARGPVLVQTPRAGYLPALACERCRTPARCRECSGPLVLDSATTPPRCGWCAHSDEQWRCPECHHRGLRAPVRGEARTAEELGRMLPGTTVRSSSGERVLQEVPAVPALVVATVGAEPRVSGGYAAVVLLDTWLTLQRDDLRSGEEALRRWMGAAGLVAPGGQVVAVGDPAHPALQALVRWDPGGYAEREMAERASAHLPPAARLATLTGSAGAIADALTLLVLPEGTDVLGPVPEGEQQRVILRCPRAAGTALSTALLELQRVRAARKLDPVRVQVDPRTM
ncbi:MAG: primosomal protein N' [Nocardioides sp.]|nr:primosomal protein N' [Nocardioides sp.]